MLLLRRARTRVRGGRGSGRRAPRRAADGKRQRGGGRSLRRESRRSAEPARQLDERIARRRGARSRRPGPASAGDSDRARGPSRAKRSTTSSPRPASRTATTLATARLRLAPSLLRARLALAPSPLRARLRARNPAARPRRPRPCIPASRRPPPGTPDARLSPHAVARPMRIPVKEPGPEQTARRVAVPEAGVRGREDAGDRGKERLGGAPVGGQRLLEERIAGEEAHARPGTRGVDGEDLHDSRRRGYASTPGEHHHPGHFARDPHAPAVLRDEEPRAGRHPALPDGGLLRDVLRRREGRGAPSGHRADGAPQGLRHRGADVRRPAPQRRPPRGEARRRRPQGRDLRPGRGRARGQGPGPPRHHASGHAGHGAGSRVAASRTRRAIWPRSTRAEPDWGVAFLDLSTGRFHAGLVPAARIADALALFRPREILLAEGQDAPEFSGGDLAAQHRLVGRGRPRAGRRRPGSSGAERRGRGARLRPPDAPGRRSSTSARRSRWPSASGWGSTPRRSPRSSSSSPRTARARGASSRSWTGPARPSARARCARP